jgi:hypothetical protein
MLGSVLLPGVAGSLPQVPARPVVFTPPPDTADWVPYVGSNTVGCTMGNPSPGGVCSSHHSYVGAIDLHMPIGTIVYSSGPGTVVFVNNTCALDDSGCEWGAGRWVGVAHPDGKVSRYVHLNSASVGVGQSVSRGQQIGVSGQSGNAVVAHTHYDEQQPLYTRAEMGDMFACHGGEFVRYPDVLGYDNWPDVPYGSVIRNDNYGCVGEVFLDVAPGHPFVDEIEWMADNDLSTGWPDRTFHPGQQVTRQAIAAFFHRQGGSPPGPFPDPGFSDVPLGHTFYTEITWMVAVGNSAGFSDGTFRPRSCVTRQAVAAFFYRQAGSPPEPFPDPGLSDVAPGDAFYTEIAWMKSVGLTTGYADGTFHPADCVSRQATAAFFSRYYS